MGRVVDIDYLVTVTDLVVLLDVRARSNVWRWIETDTSFPVPVAKIGSWLWYWPEVAQWAVKAGRVPPGAEEVNPVDVLGDRGGEPPGAARNRERKVQTGHK